MTAHGTFIIKIENNVIYTQIIGTFNAEGSDAYYSALELSVNKMPLEYYLFEDLTKFEGAVQGAYDRSNAFSESMNTKKPPVNRIIILESGLTTTIAKEETSPAFLDNTLTFETREAGLLWVEKIDKS